MKQRNSDRDTGKLQNWESYVAKINYTPPYELETMGAVDGFLVFDNRDSQTLQQSLKEAMRLILEK
jgi:hypothetical protein